MTSPQIDLINGSGIYLIPMSSDGSADDSIFGELISLMQGAIDPDRLVIQENALEVIGGFLNLGVQVGWKEYGNDVRVGAAFIRCMLTEYSQSVSKLEGESDENEKILKRVSDCFANIGDLIQSPFWEKQPEEGYRPKTNRVRYDADVKGWQKHAVCRMVGNIASNYHSDYPFFEILVNSSKESIDSEICKPFYVTIHDNEKVLDKRRAVLSGLKLFPGEVAHPIYYSSSLKNPEVFLEKTSLRIGPNARRILEGLTFLSNVKLYTQKTGNCWIKQPMRCLLASLYLEILSVKQDISPQEAWKAAKALYQEIQKTAGVSLIRELMSETTLSDSQIRTIDREISKRFSL